MITIGQAAPLFEAGSTQGTIKLKDYLGKQPVVLIFYPKDETPICTKQLCAVRDSKAQYDKHQAIVLGVNPGSLEEHQRFAQKNRYDFPLVTDTDGKIRDAFEVGKPFISLLGLQGRVVIVIGKSGNIIYASKGNRPTAEILKAIEQES
ncbi:putative peroxiredoxin bcp [compost metagenome]